MSNLIELDVNYHQQDTEWSCGAACAQMLLTSVAGDGTYVGADLGEISRDVRPLVETYQQTEPRERETGQRTDIGLYHDIQIFRDNNHLDFGGGTHPRALRYVLNLRKANNHKNIEFLGFASKNRGRIICRAIQSMEDHGIAPLLLVNAAKHWVAIRNCTYEVVSQTGTISTIDLIGISICDSSPPLNPADIIGTDHNRIDDCGKGVIDNIDHGRPASDFTKDGWLTGPMAYPIPGSLDDTFADYYVVVCAFRTDRADKPARYKMLGS